MLHSRLWVVLPMLWVHLASADGLRPEIFAPAVISGSANDLAPAFSPDGNTVYFGQSTSVQSAIATNAIATNTMNPEDRPLGFGWSTMQRA